MKGLLFTYGMTALGVCGSFISPYYGFLIYVCFGIVRPEAMWPWSVQEGNYSRMIAMALIAAWVLHGFGKWEFGRGRAVLVSLGVYWGLTFVSTILAPNGQMAWEFFEGLTKVLLPMVIGCTLIDSVARINQLAWVITLSQGFVAYEMNVSYFSGFNRLYNKGFGPLDNNTATVSMVLCAGLAFFLALQGKSRLRQGVAAIIFVLSAHAVMFSFSRGALLALIACALAAFAVIPKRPLYVGAFIVAVLIGYRLAGKEVVARFSSTFAAEEDRDSSAESRLTLWRGCMTEMMEHPLVGIGPEHWKLVSERHTGEAHKAAHSTWMQTGAECGVFALAALGAFFGLTILRSWQVARDRAADPELQAIACGVMCSLCGFVVGAQFVSIALVEMPYYLVAVGIGVMKLAEQQPAAGDFEHDAVAWQGDEAEAAYA